MTSKRERTFRRLPPPRSSTISWQRRDLQRAIASMHNERIAEDVFGDPSNVTIDGRGRLVIVDDTPVSDVTDQDADGFEEVIVVGGADTGRIIEGNAQPLDDSVRATVGDWGLLPGWRLKSGLFVP
jgi:secreted PhoX family phosphatase